METNGYLYHHGSTNGTNGAFYGNSSGIVVPRILTVDEALPYSPFSSVVPFNSEIIPLPTVGLRASTSIFSTPQEREEGRRGLESLNREAQAPYNTSQKLQKSLNDLKELLNPSTIPQYKFKTTPKIAFDSGSKEQLKVTLSPFARMVYDSANISYTYPSPQRPSSPIQNNKPAPTQPTQNRKPTTPQPRSPAKSRSPSNQRLNSNQRAYHQNSVIDAKNNGTKHRTSSEITPVKPNSSFAVVIPGLPNDFRRNEYSPSQNPVKERVKMATAVQTQVQAPARTQSHVQAKIQVPVQEKPPSPKISPPSSPSPLPPESLPLSQSSNTGLAVVIPNPPSTFRCQDYEVLPDSPDTPQHMSRKRKRSEAGGDEDELSRSVDQREKAEAAFRHLREYLQEIFEAEDQLQPDNFTPNQIFTAASDGPTLSITAQTKAENLLQKIISVGRFTQAPLDDLLRLQKLCDTAIKDAENVDLKLDETMGQAEVEQWVLQVSTAELGMRAARTSLRLMSGGREEKQLYSEDVIHSALNAFKNITDNCLIPVVEMRGSGPSSSLFKLLSAEKKVIMNLLSQCRRLFTLMATLVSTVELSETVITILEFTASKLIFVENAHSEKDSILGVSKFDSFRVVAMDVLAQIFLSNPAQRPGIFDEILTSLEKLPVTKQSARQFKLAEGGSIQLVSALIMRLIQTSAAKTQNIKGGGRSKALETFSGDADEDESDQTDKAATAGRVVITTETKAEQQPAAAIQELKDAASPLLDTARQNATYVVGFIVNRAMNSTKTGDAPYRNLLDLFVEDFITCLNSTDWPAAELLLRLFLFKMVHLAEGDKTPAPAKNMALDLLAVMGAAISELNSHVRKASNSLESADDDLGRYLSGLAEASLDKKASAADIISWPAGPFRACLEFLEERSAHGDNPQLRSAIGFFMAEWASKIMTTFDLISDEDDHAQLEKEYGRLAYRLRMMISDSRWLSTEYSFETVSPAHARLAYSLTLLHSQFCESFGRVLTILLGSMTSEQATVRSKSLRSVNQVLDTDPTIIDREPAVKHLILRCSNDISIQVRDSALGLIGKCIHLRPALEEEMIPHILQRVNDSGVGVRKRAIKLSKDIYLKNQNRNVRSLIADALLHRVNDLDEGVQELARQTIEEVWMSPFYQSSSSDNTSPTFKLAMADHVALMVQTVQRNSGVAMVLDKVLQGMLSNNAKYTSANFKVCKALVATMFETIIDNTVGEDKDAPSARDALQILMIFAKSNPKLFNADQVQLLQPYIAHVAGGDDLAIYRSVVVIFRHVLPDLSKAHHNFLAAIRKDLIPAVSKMPKAILDDVVACLWIISSVLDDFQHLTRLVLSSLSGIQKMKGIKFDEAGVRKICKLLLITGICGKHCDLDPQYEIFQRQFPLLKDKSVSRLMIDTFAPFASPSQPLEVRKSAFDAIGMVCQSWPKSFLATNIDTSFREVFNERESQIEKLKKIEESEETDENNKKKNAVLEELEKNAMLETIVLKSFRDFMLLEEKRSEAQNEDLPGAAADPKAKLGVMGGGQGDGVALSISQKFLPHVINIALSRQDDMGLLATELVASVARQGLVHPKETGSSLIALETSKNIKIAEIAFREHRALHEKHETILEKEYMRAVHMAYTYQKNVIKNTHGATLNPYTAKLYMMVEVMKISKPKSRKRFYDSLCARMQFDPIKMDDSQLPEHLEFSQFIIENMAFFDYSTIDELLSAINAMEKVVSDMGTSLALSIETEIFQINLNQPSQVDENGRMKQVPATINPIRLRKLTAVSMMLSSLWGARTHLRRQYGLMINRREGKNKATTKDFNRAPIRVAGVTGDKFWEEIGSTMDSLDSEEAMMAQCRAFVELLTIDHDFKIATEGDEEADRARMSTPDGDDEETSNAGTPGPPGSKRGRKRKEAPTGTPSGRKNKRARSSSAQPRPRARVKSSGKRASVEKSDDEGEAW